MGFHLEVLILGLVSACLLWEGVQCRSEVYNLTAPDDVSVAEGLCVLIPCSFTYKSSDAKDASTLYGYWYEEGKDKYDPAVATNNNRKLIAGFALNRFHLSEDLGRGNCSLTINDAQGSDNGAYYFRVEKYPRAIYGYTRFNQPTVSVTKLENPEIKILGKLRAGFPVNITCTTPGSCALKPPNITWEGISEEARSGISALLPNGTHVHSTVFNFVASVADHGQKLTCSVRYGSETSSVYRAETIQLDVNYPPWKPKLYGNLTHSNKTTMKNYTGDTQLTAHKGDSIVLRCEVKGNPLPNVTWTKKSQSEWTPASTSGNTLKLSDLKESDMGEYKCRAQNPEGSNETTFQLSLRYSPGVCKEEIPHCKKDSSGFQCKCSICSFPSPKITWQVNGEILEGNTTQGKMEVTTWNTETVGTSTLLFIGDWDGEHHISCHGANSEGELDTIFYLFSSAGDMLTSSIVSAVIGALIMFVIVMLIIAIIVTSKKCRRKSVTGSTPYTKQLVQGEIPTDVKRSSINGGTEVPKVQGKTDESADETPNDAEDLHYATLEFKLKETVPQTIPEEPQTEYAEIKTL